MSYTITNNIMYVRDDAGNLVPVSMIASGADQTIQAIKATASAAEAQISTKVSDANAAIEAKTDEQAARIPEVTTLVENVNGLKDDLSDKLPKSPANWEAWTAEEQAAARERLHGSFKKIIDVTLEEDVTAGITFAYDADGNDINAQDICVDVYLPVEYTQNNINFRVRLKIGNEDIDSFRAFNAGGLLNRRQRFMMFSIGELRVPVHGTPTTNLGYINAYPAHIASSFAVIPGSVSQIFIELYGGMLPAGSIIEIYAR